MSSTDEQRTNTAKSTQSTSAPEQTTSPEGQTTTTSDFEDYGAIVAFDRKSGSHLWTADAEQSRFEQEIQGVASSNGRVFYGVDSSGRTDTTKPVFRGVDAGSGEELWEFPTQNGHIAGIHSSDNRVYAYKGHEGYLLDAVTGEQLQKISYSPGFHGFGRAQNRIYVLETDGHRSAIDISSNETLWEVNSPYSPNAFPYVSEDGVYFGTEAGYLIAIDPTDGSQIWETRVDGVIRQQPSVTNDLVWVIDESQGAYAIRKRDGKILTKISTSLAEHRRQLWAIDDVLFFRGEDGTRVKKISTNADLTEVELSDVSGFEKLTDRGFHFFQYSINNWIAIGAANFISFLNSRGEVEWESENVEGYTFGPTDAGLGISWSDSAVYVAGQHM